MIKKFVAYTLLAYMACLLFFAMCPEFRSRLLLQNSVYSELPDFTSYEDTKQRKTAFFSYLRPLIEHKNAELKIKRAQLLVVKNHYHSFGNPSPGHNRLLAIWEKEYLLKENLDLSTQLSILEKRINQIPPSLVLAQAANESAWGTSRFAQDANNLFGHWCYRKGCGIIPANRPAGAKHEVRRFSSAYDSVSAYFHNINTHRAYSQLRTLRQELTRENATISGDVLAQGLTNYSEQGQDYIDELRQIIKVNRLK